MSSIPECKRGREASPFLSTSSSLSSHLCLFFGCTVEGNPDSQMPSHAPFQLVQLPLCCVLNVLEKMTTK
jgi:hypothetical protein